MNPIEEWTDAFENQVSARTNVLDLASHYPYSPERWRLSVDGARVYPEYDSVAQYTHDTDVHALQPAAGETVTLESAERPRYVVQYELATSWAFAITQALQSGDSIRVGLYDGTDGWYMEQTGAHATDTADFVLERNGTTVYRHEAVDIHAPTTTFARLKLQTGWYDVTRQRWERSYSLNGTQLNPQIGSFSADATRGSRTGNLPVHYSVTASESTAGLVLSAGSTAQANLGTTVPQTRSKTAAFTTSVATTGTWVPVYAIRVAPDRTIVNTQLMVTDVVEFSGSGDIRVMPRAFAPEHLADGGGNALTDADFSTPAEHSATNSVIEETAAVDQFADATGTVGPSAADPGGYQLGFAGWWSSGSGLRTQIEGGMSTPKRGIRRDDICVFLANAEDTGDVTVEYVTEQDW